MKVAPVDEKEYSMRNVWPKGVYPCTVAKCEEGASKKSGDPFFKCEVQIFNDAGNYRTVTSYIMGAGKAAWQLRSAAEAFNVLEKYRAGELTTHDIEGKNAYAKVGVEEDESGQYGPKNIIREFTAKPPKSKATDGASAPSGHPVNDEPPLDDSIPF